ncbi:MAG: hypothetical protein ACRDF4_07190 [Rhabdochlamydiaceae bacterium]
MDTITKWINVYTWIRKSELMPKYKENASEFSVSVNYNEHRGYAATIPRPIMEFLGKPDKITYSIKGKKVEVEAAKDE